MNAANGVDLTPQGIPLIITHSRQLAEQKRAWPVGTCQISRVVSIFTCILAGLLNSLRPSRSSRVHVEAWSCVKIRSAGRTSTDSCCST